MTEPTPFTWRDGERLVRFGRGLAAEAPSLLEGPYALLTTPRAERSAPGLVAGAAEVHHVGPGHVDALSAELLGRVQQRTIVALGGGRVIDTAKALAAVAGGARQVVAVPTTLSGAEMTALHRLPAGAPARSARVRPRVVIADPALSASQPEPELVASALNALAHCAEAPLTTGANPVATLAALAGARLIARGLSRAVPDRDSLALGALLGGYAIDSAGYGLHHVVSQTLVRFAGVGHGPANAVMLPHTLHALARRFPRGVARLADALDADPVVVAQQLRERAGAERLGALGVAGGRLGDLARRAAGRPELALTPPPADAQEIRVLYETAF